ncbi:MAG TPA: DM13 domain-containing protein [Candidatus Limnocylindrales bacterium]|nr:DM13 domain-containing protein [Candidatus Limnocylindrales bacterium]
MPFASELERLVAAVYPNRVPIAICSLVVVVVLAVVARRRGWDRAAWRHPRQAIAVAAVVAAIGIPAAWYLASPLFIRTELVEAAPAPAAAAASSIAPATRTPSTASAAPSESASQVPAQSPTPAPLALAGTFAGADDFHFGRGSATVVETSPGRYTVRLERFSVRNGPDLYVYLSPDRAGYAKGAIELGRLKATDGSFNYAVPAGADSSRFASVVIWCKAFSVEFASATLKPR